MSLIVFLRGVNVGGANRCQPAKIARQLAEFNVVNIGAVGTFVVRGRVSESTLRANIAVQLAKGFGVKCQIMIVPARNLIKVTSQNPFSAEPSGPDITRFVSVLAKRPRTVPTVPLSLPSHDDWLLKIVSIQEKFVVGLYRRQMKAIGYLGKIETLLGVPATTRSWNTIEKIVKILTKD